MNPGRERPLLRLLVGLVILVELIFGVLYAVNTPRWEAPDEPAQFNYVRHVAETGTLPVLNPGDYDQAYLERIKADKFPPTFSIDAIRYESYEPPLFYILAAPVYLAARAMGLDLVIALRLFSLVLGVLLLLLANRVFVQVFPTSEFLALAGVGFMATLPMHIAMSAAINADTFAEVLLAVLLLISLARARGGLDDRRFVLLGGIVYGLTLLTSIKIYAGGLLLILAELAFRGQRSKAGGWSVEFRGWRLEVGGLRTLLALFGVSLILSFWWFARNALVYGGTDIFGLTRHNTVVTGQPTTAEWVAKYGLKNVLADFIIITFKSFWAQFGWMGVLVDERFYVALFVLTTAATLGVLLWIFRLRRGHGNRREELGRVWVLLGAWLLVALLDHALYNLHYFQPQGRYLFPALIPIAALVVIGLDELVDKRYTRIVFALLYVAMVWLDYASLFWFIIPQLRS